MFLLITSLMIIGCSGVTEALPAVEKQEVAIVNTEPVDEEPAGVEKTESKTVVFALTGENYQFMMNGQENPDLKVSLGDKVRIEFTAASGFHDWSVGGFNIATEKVSDGQSSSVEFVADKKGTFEYYCSVGSHRQMGMKGKLIVE